MLVISNGASTLRVTKGAYRAIYMHQGYHIVSSAGASAPAPDGDSLMRGIAQGSRNETGVGNPPTGEESASSSNSGAENQISNDEDISDGEYDADLEETPISDMTVSQLRKYAERIGVELDGTETKRELRQLIRENLG